MARQPRDCGVIVGGAVCRGFLTRRRHLPRGARLGLGCRYALPGHLRALPAAGACGPHAGVGPRDPQSRHVGRHNPCAGLVPWLAARAVAAPHTRMGSFVVSLAVRAVRTPADARASFLTHKALRPRDGHAGDNAIPADDVAAYDRVMINTSKYGP